MAERLNSFAFPHRGYVTFLKVITTVGHPAVFEAVTVAVAAWLLVRRRPRLAVWLAVTVFGGGFLSTIVKDAVGRSRPLLPHPVAHAVSASFPSGHAIGSVVGVGALLVFLPYVRRSLRPALIALGGAGRARDRLLSPRARPALPVERARRVRPGRRVARGEHSRVHRVAPRSGSAQPSASSRRATQVDVVRSCPSRCSGDSSNTQKASSGLACRALRPGRSEGSCSPSPMDPRLVLCPTGRRGRPSRA